MPSPDNLTPLQLTYQPCRDQSSEAVRSAIPPTHVTVALRADSESPGVPRKPAVRCRRLTNIGSPRRITVADQVERVASRVAEIVLMRLDGQCRAGYDMTAGFASNSLLRLSRYFVFKVDRNTLAHEMHPYIVPHT